LNSIQKAGQLRFTLVCADTAHQGHTGQYQAHACMAEIHGMQCIAQPSSANPLVLDRVVGKPVQGENIYGAVEERNED
jgi:hypothetical protein